MLTSAWRYRYLRDGDDLRFHVVPQPEQAVLAADSRSLGSAKGNPAVRATMAVDPGGANFQATRQCRGAGGIRAPYRSAKTARRPICALHCIVRLVAAPDRRALPDTFLVHPPASFAHSCYPRRPPQ